MKSLVINGLIIIAAAGGVILLLKKGGEAGISAVKQVRAPVRTTVATARPVRPQAIEAQIDNFNVPFMLQPIHSWGVNVQSGFILSVSPNPNVNQPSVRLILVQPPEAPIILEIEYTVAENMVAMMEANSAVRSNGVAVQVATEGSNYNTSVLLKLNPLLRPEERRWFSHNLILPPGTKEVQFWIAGIPPHYNVSGASCAISLPQLHVVSRMAFPAWTARPTPIAVNL